MPKSVGCCFALLWSRNTRVFVSQDLTKSREAPVRFGYGLGMERFKRFRFSVLAVPLQKGFSVFQYSLTGKEGSSSSSGSWKAVPAVPVPLSVSGKTVPTVPVSSSVSVPEPPC